MSIADKLSLLAQTKADIKDAIIEKGQELTDEPFSEYADKIRAIEGGGEDDGLSLYVFQPGDWIRHTSVDIPGVQNISASDLFALYYDPSITAFYTYEGSDPYIIIPARYVDANTTVVPFPYSMLQALLLGAFTGQQPGVEAVTYYPTGIAGKSPPSRAFPASAFLVPDTMGIPRPELNYLNTGLVENFYNWFQESKIVEIDLSRWDVSSGTNFKNMFISIPTLKSLDLSGWDVSNGTDFSDMFRSCGGLKSINLSGWDVSSGTNFRYMFGFCSSLKSLDLSGWDVSNGTDFSYMFQQCTNLLEIYTLSPADADKLTTGTNIRSGVSVYIGKRGAPGTYLYKTT